MGCPHCHQLNPPEAKFCLECGTSLAHICSTCGTRFSLELEACPHCLNVGLTSSEISFRDTPTESSTLKKPPEKILSTSGKIEGERKQVTVLLADMKGYTPLAERLGEEAVYGLMNQVYEGMLNAVHKHEGTVQELTGDGILALFGAPGAVEDAPLRACRAALDIQIQMNLLEKRFKGTGGVLPKLRIGINTGPVVVGTVGTELHMEFKAIGDTVNMAAALEAIAEPGKCLLSESTQRRVEAFVLSTTLGQREVKGKSVPVPVFRLEGLRPQAIRFDAARRRGLTPLVGRQHELKVLEQAYEEVCRGQTRVVNVVGEAGIGKSRLVHEFCDRLDDERQILHIGHCTIDGRSIPFMPFLEVLRSVFGLIVEDNQEEMTNKLSRGIEHLGMDAQSTLPILLNLFGLREERESLRGLDGAIVGARTRDVLQTLTREECKLSPVVLVIDDLHWIDSASAELVRRMVVDRESIPLLLLFAYRPGIPPDWAKEGDVTELRIEPLSEQDTITLSQKRIGVIFPKELSRLLVEKAEGNPLFAEEITSYLIDSGYFAEPEMTQSCHSSSGDTIPVPSTIQDLFMSRMDQQEKSSRLLLQIAAVIGRQFHVDLLADVLGMNGNDAIDSYIQELEEHELIMKEADQREAYRFRHVLIQDTIYQSLLKHRREELHQKVAESIERLYANGLGKWAEVLAYHYSRTGRLEKAVHYLSLAAQRSLKLYSLEESHSYYQQVMELIHEAPGTVDDAFLSDTLLGWVFVYYYRSDFKGIIDLLERYHPRVEALHDPRRLSLHLFWLGLSYVSAAEGEVAKPLFEKALVLAEKQGDEECIGYASVGLMYVCFLQQGRHDPDAPYRYNKRVLEIAQKANNVWLAAKSLTSLAIYQVMGGRYSKGRLSMLELLELGHKAGDQRTEARALWMLGWVNNFDERYEEAIENAEECLRITRDPIDRACAYSAKGAALAFLGRSEEGLQFFSLTKREIDDGGFFMLLIPVEIPYGLALVFSGKIAEGIRSIESSMRLFSGWGNEAQVAMGHLVLGEIYLQMILGERKLPQHQLLHNLGFILRTFPFASRKARRHLEEAIRKARDIDIPATLARGLLDLGLLHNKKGRSQESVKNLKEALQVAEAEDLPVLSEKISKALNLYTPKVVP